MVQAMEQQGDVLFKKMELPKGLKFKKLKEVRLVESQATGHCHRAAGPALAYAEQDGKKYIKAAKAFQVFHEEHHTLKVPAGTYFVDQPLDYDHFSEEARAVAD